MAQLFRDRIINFEQFDVSPNEDIFFRILKEKEQEKDNKRFFLNYVPDHVLSRYDFRNADSINEFRNACIGIDSPLMSMGGCNLGEKDKNKGIRYNGIKISDPYGVIPGVFDINNKIITYSPIFPLFYLDRDNIKYAKDIYFTSITFQEVILNQINNAIDYYVHVGNYSAIKDILKYGKYILKKIDKEQMIEFVKDPQKGQKILSRYLGIK